jgi:hypothetical protein
MVTSSAALQIFCVQNISQDTVINNTNDDNGPAMPPQPGIFALPYGTTHSQGGGLNRKRKEVSGKLGKEMGDRRDELSFCYFLP